MIDVHTLIPILRTYNISEKTIQKIVKLKNKKMFVKSKKLY